ncbi:MAG: hypothetical protein IPJ66_08935 [Bacteroidetes bacterium]|nr:hypothetical protein [Bacteroidota bacterium]
MIFPNTRKENKVYLYNLIKMPVYEIKLPVISVLLPLWVAAQKDKVVCDTLKADLDSGFVNKLKPDAHIDSLKKYLPCYSEELQAGEDSKCGAGLVYDRLNFAAYVDNDYFEFRKGFIGSSIINCLDTMKNMFSLSWENLCG